MRNKLRVRCAAHGWFEQVPQTHLSSTGCSKCGRIERVQRQLVEGWHAFFENSNVKFNGRYQYDRSSWRGTNFKLAIHCPEHGWFEQKVGDHLRLTGCTQCGYELAGLKGRLTEHEIIERFRQTHGDRYDYSNLNYTISSEKLTITCKIHGDFKQKLIDHQKGDGCPKCGKRHRWSTDEFIANSQAVHADKYTYENTQYTGALNKITITCKIHGDFTTQPARHVLGKNGCPKCSVVAHLTQEDFLQRATERFGQRYDYSLVEFVNVATPVKIICAKHGIFEQPPTYHLNNAIGCGQCSYNVSTKETQWLDTFDMSINAKRNIRIDLDGRKRSVDAFDPESNTVYEFWGDWWHGHPDFFDSNEVHPKTKTTYGELYEQTLEKRQAIVRHGYTLVEIWEHEFDRYDL